ncbi:MAG: ABC transporter ATP-binding protein [Acetobacteraceae bacterium]|nr:ABC transporter ATP-binding protein [Acetobacteraceae bacterium]
MPLLRVEGLRKNFPLPTGRLLAVDGVDLELERGETLAIVGESGCGKSTLGRLVLRLQEPDAGRISLDDTDIGPLKGSALRTLRRRMQIIFQDPFSSLDPRQRVGDVLTRPMRLHGLTDRAGAAAAAAVLIERVGLSAAQLALLPHGFSGGQRQRIAIARALCVQPDLIVCDEPVSALDVSVQAQIINLLADLQRDSGVALLFISHDLAVVRQLAHRVAVMYAGRIVETGATEAVFRAPAHPYTRALLAAVPQIGSRIGDEPAAGEPPDMTRPPPGCRFASRCPEAKPACTAGAAPALHPLSPSHASACLFAADLPPFAAPSDAALPDPVRTRIAAYRSARDRQEARA